MFGLTDKTHRSFIVYLYKTFAIWFKLKVDSSHHNDNI